MEKEMIDHRVMVNKRMFNKETGMFYHISRGGIEVGFATPSIKKSHDRVIFTDPVSDNNIIFTMEEIKAFPYITIEVESEIIGAIEGIDGKYMVRFGRDYVITINDMPYKFDCIDIEVMGGIDDPPVTKEVIAFCEMKKERANTIKQINESRTANENDCFSSFKPVWTNKEEGIMRRKQYYGNKDITSMFKCIVVGMAKKHAFSFGIFYFDIKDTGFNTFPAKVVEAREEYFAYKKGKEREHGINR